MNKYFLTPPSNNEIVLNNIIEQINKEGSSSTHEIASLSSSAKPGEASPEAKPKPHHEPSSMDKYLFLTPQTNNEIVLNKLNLKKSKTIAKRLGLRNYSQYNSKTKSDLIKFILKEDLDAGDWLNKLSRLNIKKLKSIAEKLVIEIKQNSKKTDLVNRISDNVNNENLNTVLKEIGSQSLEKLLEETMSKNESTQNTTIKELLKKRISKVTLK
jgi:hypothetical protein